MTKSRIGFVDVARGIAMISIILGHMKIGEVNAVVYTYHVPVFLLITGYFISRKDSIGKFSLKRLRTTMIPYIFTSVVMIGITALQHLTDGRAGDKAVQMLSAAAYGSGNIYNEPFRIESIGPIWFLPAICIAAILFRLILELPEKLRPVLVGACFAAGYLTTKYIYWFPMSVQAGFCSVLFLYVGWLFRQNEEQIMGTGKELKFAAALAGVWIWYSFIRNYEGFYVVRSFYGRGVIDIFCSLCACGVVLLISWAIDRWTKITGGLLRFAGRYSLLVLCVHAVEQNLFKWYDILDQYIYVPAATYNWIMVFFRPAFALFFTWLLLKLPFIRAIFGYNRKS